MNHHSACGCGSKQLPCGCCAGVESVTPISVANRPGLSALSYRAGTHATFLETMIARLSTMCLGTEEECRTDKGLRPLRDLTTRELDDPSIALLDAWAIVADVLTFYEERIANEGYLRTATERRSILELARLVGYRLRPGVAASVYLALTLEDAQNVVIEPYQLRAQSVPGQPNELPQTFENIEKLEARGLWNKLKPRLTQPQNVAKLSDPTKAPASAKLYLKGASTGLNENDPLLVVAPNSTPVLYRIVKITPDNAAERTEIVITPWAQAAAKHALHTLVSDFGDAGAAGKALDALTSELSGTKSDAELADHIETETLPALERIAARKNIKAELRSRISALSEDIASATTALRANALEGETISGTDRRTGASATEDELAVVMRGDSTRKKGSQGLTTPESIPPANLIRLGRKVESAFATRSDLGIQAVGFLQPSLRANLTTALGNVALKHEGDAVEIYALRVKASPFGHNAPLRSKITETLPPNERTRVTVVTFSEWVQDDVDAAEDFLERDSAGLGFSTVIYLDGSYDKIQQDSWVVVDTSAVDLTNASTVKPAHDPPPLIVQAAKVQAGISRGAYGMSGKATRIELSGAVNDAAWLKDLRPAVAVTAASAAKVRDDFQVIRRTVVYAQSELLALAEEPIKDPICATPENQGWIRLDRVYSELKSGRWVIVSGERSDVVDESGKTLGVQGSELAMLSEVVHDFNGMAPGESERLPGDPVHTRIRFAGSPAAKPDTSGQAGNLSFCYQRDKVAIYANVTKATHGETRTETLGSGDGSKSFQQFDLKQPPLTYVSAPTTSGVASTLKVFVNDVEWHEAETIFGLKPPDRQFITTRNNDEVTTAVFGNGKRGARLPTGKENVRAQYRQGLGKGANVAENTISMLTVRPLGVKEVINPRPATGGADPETRDQARKNAPLAVLALDRLVSTSDYGDFARTFGGVGKAFATRLSDGQREVVHVTIAGVDDAPIAESSDLFLNLQTALTRFGDPALPVILAIRELLLLVISARVRLLPDYVWEKVAPRIRTKLLDTLSFENRELGQDVFLSEVISAMQKIEGVAYVDVDLLGKLVEKNDDGTVRTPNELLASIKDQIEPDPKKPNKPTQPPPAQRVRVNLPELPTTSGGQIRPAQLAYLTADVPDTLILNLIDHE